MAPKAILATMAMLALSPASASARSRINYTFTGYCDGISATVENNSQYAGVHDGKCEANEPAGGFKVRIGGVPFSIADLATTDTKNAPGVQLIYWLNIKGLSWELFYVSGGAVTFAKSGTLTPGAPDPHSTAPATSAGL